MVSGKLNSRFWVSAVLAAVSALLIVLTAVRRNWFEAILPFDPDADSGAVEWMVILALVSVSAACSRIALAGWRHARQAASAS